MLVVIVFVPIVAQTELVSYTVASIFNDMYQMVLAEQCQDTENT